MTQEEFSKTDFIGKIIGGQYLRILYRGQIYEIAGLDEEEYLFGIRDIQNSDDISYKRCENCTLV